MTLITIITPSYNSIQYIENCILNVLKQDILNVEHLIVDGGSTDGTVEIIKKYAESHSHLKWISEKDNGQSEAMNKGIRLAQGEYISFLNVDDSYIENIFNHWKNLINKYNFLFYSGNCNVFNNTAELLYTSRPRYNNFFHFYFKQSYPINPCSYFYKKSIHEEIGFYKTEEHFCMDLEFILRYMNKYKYYYYEDLVWGNFYLTETSKTFIDNSLGNMQNRKKELFDYFWKKNSFLVRMFYILRNKLFDKL